MAERYKAGWVTYEHLDDVPGENPTRYDLLRSGLLEINLGESDIRLCATKWLDRNGKDAVKRAKRIFLTLEPADMMVEFDCPVTALLISLDGPYGHGRLSQPYHLAITRQVEVSCSTTPRGEEPLYEPIETMARSIQKMLDSRPGAAQPYITLKELKQLIAAFHEDYMIGGAGLGGECWSTDKVDLDVVADFWNMVESELHSNKLAAANSGMAPGSSTARLLALFLALLFAWVAWIALPS